MLGKKLSYQINGSTVEFEFEHGTAYVTAVTDTIMNVFVPYQSLRRTEQYRLKQIN